MSISAVQYFIVNANVCDLMSKVSNGRAADILLYCKRCRTVRAVIDYCVRDCILCIMVSDVVVRSISVMPVFPWSDITGRLQSLLSVPSCIHRFHIIRTVALLHPRIRNLCKQRFFLSQNQTLKIVYLGELEHRKPYRETGVINQLYKFVRKR